MAYLIDFVLHIDSHLVTIVNTFGNWTYLILFAIIFIETGAVIMPFSWRLIAFRRMRNGGKPQLQP